MTLVQDSSQGGRSQTVSFLRRLYEEAGNFGGLVNQRGFAELCARVRREQRDTDVLGDLDAGHQVVAFVQHLIKQYSEKQEPKSFIEKYLLGKPVFNYEVEGEQIDILSHASDEFTLWSFSPNDSDKKRTISELLALANKAESISGKRFARLILFHPNPPRFDVISRQVAEGLVNRVQSAPAPPRKIISIKDKRAAVVILDIEGQFRKHIEGILEMTTDIQRGLGLSDKSETSFFSIPGNACLSYSELSFEDLTYFTPDLSAKSQDSFRTALAHVKTKNPEGFDETVRMLEDEIEHGVRNFQIRQALARTTTSLRRIFTELFDKDLVAPLQAEKLLVPGKITVIDVSALTENDQRYVAIYLLAILHNAKMTRNDMTRTVLVIDEAHKMFPRSPPVQYKDFYQRIYSFVSDIVHKGRKRQYSVVIATQQPKDVADMILNLPDTKIVFEVEGERRWVSDLLKGREPPRGVGSAYVVLKGALVDPLPIRIPSVMGKSVKKGTASDAAKPTKEGLRVGYVIQREKNPLKYDLNQGQIFTNIPFKHAPLVIPGQILVARGIPEGSNHPTTLFCEAQTLKGYEIRLMVTSKAEDGLRDMVNEGYETTVVLQVKREISADGYDGPLRNQNYTNLQVYLPTEEEVRKCFNLPEMGFPLGELTFSATTGNRLVYFLPYNPFNYGSDSSDWQIDHSVLVVGSQGRGKTNFLLYLSALLVCSAPEEVGQRLISG